LVICRIAERCSAGEDSESLEYSADSQSATQQITNLRYAAVGGDFPTAAAPSRRHGV